MESLIATIIILTAISVFVIAFDYFILYREGFYFALDFDETIARALYERKLDLYIEDPAYFMTTEKVNLEKIFN